VRQAKYKKIFKKCAEISPRSDTYCLLPKEKKCEKDQKVKKEKPCPTHSTNNFPYTCPQKNLKNLKKRLKRLKNYKITM